MIVKFNEQAMYRYDKLTCSADDNAEKLKKKREKPVALHFVCPEPSMLSYS